MCCAYVSPQSRLCMKVLEANGVTTPHGLSNMPTEDLISTLKLESLTDSAMIGRVYVPILRAAITTAGKLRASRVLPATMAPAQNNTKKRSRSAELRKQERRAENKRRKAEDASAKPDNGEADRANALLAKIGAAIKPRPHMSAINTLDRLKALTLDGSFDLDQCPPPLAVRNLATTAAAQQKALGMIDYPFVNDLHKVLPGWCADACPVVEEHGTGDSGNNNKRTLDPMVWRIAWDRFALAAAIVGTMPLDTAMRHLDEVSKLTLDGRTMGGRMLNLGTVYDLVCRRKWAEYSQALRGEFSIVDMVNDPTERAKMKE